MKKYAYMMMAALLLSAISCNKQAANNEEEGEELHSDDLEYLVDCLVRLDDNGAIAGYNFGDCLNEADPSEVSVPVEDYAEAKAMFHKWLTPDANVTVSGNTETWNLADNEGKAQGSAILAPGSGEKIAILTLPLGQVVSKVIFLADSAWPENADVNEILQEEYYLGAVVYKEKDEGFGNGDYIVIREWSKKECGIMIQMDTKKYDETLKTTNRKKLSSLGTLHNVYEALHRPNVYETIVEVTGKEYNWPSLDHKYLSKKHKTVWYLLQERYYYVNLETNSEGWIGNEAFKFPSYYKAYIYCFKPNGKKIKFW